MLGRDSTPIYLCPRDDYHSPGWIWAGWVSGLSGMESEIFVVSRILSSRISSQRKSEALSLLRIELSRFFIDGE